MTSGTDAALDIPPALLAEIQAVADQERLPAAALVKSILEAWLGQRHRRGQVLRAGRLTPAQAVERILEVRKGTAVPAGTTVREMMAHGRA